MAKQLNVNLSFTADTAQAKAQIQSLQQSLTSLINATKSSSNGMGTANMAKDLQQATIAAAQLKVHLQNATNVNTGNLDFTKLSQSLKTAGTDLQSYGQQLLKLGPEGQQAFVQLARSVSQAEVPITRLSARMSGMVTVLKNTLRWQISSTAIHALMGGISGAYHYAQNLNESLNNIRIVTGQSTEQMSKFAEQANKAAKALSASTLKYTDAALIYYQQGLSDQEVLERTNTTVKMANVSGQSAEKVSEQMTAIWNNFDDGSKSLEYYGDVITALGATTAASSEEIATGLSKFSAVAETVGLSYEYATAALATITATTRQSADTVGTALRTLFARLEGLQLGETLEDGVDLNKYSKALDAVGVKVIDVSGQMRSMDDILSDLASRWDTLSQAQQVALAQTVGGVRQYTNLIALMDNWDFMERNLGTASTAEGTLQKQADIYAESWEAAQKRVKAAAESIYSDLLSDKFFIEITNGFEKVLSGLDLFIDGLGGLKGVLLTLGSIATIFFKDQIAAGLRDATQTFRMLIPNQRAKIQEQKSKDLKEMIQGAQTGQLSVADQSRLNNLEKELQLQNQINAASKNMTADQLSVANILMDSVRIQEERLAKTLEEGEVLKKNAQLRKEDITTKAWESGVANGLSNNKIKKALSNGFYGFTDKATGEYQNGANVYTTKVQSALKTLATDSFKAGVGVESLKVQLEEVLKGLNVKGIRSSFISDLIKDFNSGELTLEQFKIKLTELFMKADSAGGFQNLKLQLQQTGMTVGEAEQLVEKYRQALIELSQTEGDLTQATAKLATAQQNVEQALSRPAKGDWATSLTTYAGMAMNLGMVMSSLSGVIDTLNNEDLSFGEKLTSVLTSGAMAVTMFMNLLSSLKALQLSVSVTTLGTAIAEGVFDIATKKATQSVIAQTIANIALEASLSPILVGVLAIVAALALLVGAFFAIRAIANAIETPAEKTKRLSEELEHAEEAAKNAKDAYDKLMGDVDNHNQLLDKLNDCTKGTVEFTQALLEANSAALELIKNNNFVQGKDYNIDSRGAIVFNQDSIKAAQERHLQNLQDAQLEVSAANVFSSINSERIERKYSTEEAVQTAIELFDDYVERGGAGIEGTGENFAEYIKNTDYYEIDKEKLDNYAKQMGYIAEDGNADLAQLYSSQSQNDLYPKNGLNDYQNFITQSLSADGSYDAADQLISQVLANRYNSTELERQVAEATKGVNKLSGEALIGTAKAELGQDRYNILTSSEEYKKADPKEQEKQLRQAIIDAKKRTVLQSQIDDATLQMAQTVSKDFNNYEKLTGSEFRELIQKHTGPNASEESQLAAEAALKIQTDSATDLAKTLLSNSLVSSSSEDMAQLLASSDMSIGDYNLSNSLISQITSTFGKDSGKNLTSKLLFGEQDGKVVLNRELANVLSGIDLSDKISGLFDLKKAIKNTDNSQLVGELASLYGNMFNDIGGEAGLLKELYDSEEFSDTLSNLQKEFEKTGEISAQSILDAADSCELLNELLEEGEFSAGALADAFTMVAEGQFGIDEISSALIKGLTAANDYSDALLKLYDYVDDFKLPESIEKVDKFYSGLAKDVQEGLEGGRFFDEPVLASIKELFGNDVLTEYKNKVIEGSRNNLTTQQILDSLDPNMVNAILGIQETGNLSSLYKYQQDRGNLPAGINYNEETGQVIVDQHQFDVGSSGDDLNDALAQNEIYNDRSKFVDYLRKNGNMSETMAEAMAMDLAARDGDLADAWQRTGANKGYEELKKAAQEGSVTLDQLEAYIDKYQDYLDSDKKTAKEMANTIRDHGGIVTDFTKDVQEGNATLSQLIEESDYTYTDSEGKEHSGNDYYEVMGQREYATPWSDNTFSFDETIKAYEKLGLSADAAYKYMEQSGENYVATLTDDFGNVQEVTWQAGQSFEEFQKNCDEALNASNAQHQAELFAQAFKEALINAGDEPINITVTDDGTVEDVQTLIKNVQDGSAAVIVSDNGTVAAIDQSIKDLVQYYKDNPPTIDINVNGNIPGGGDATGGYVPSYANGGLKKLSPGLALTGEEGAEIVWNKEQGYAYITGEKHAEFQMLRPGDRVFNAQETKKILGTAATGGFISASAGYGTGKLGALGSKGGSGSAASKAAKSWEIERYHVINEQISDLENAYKELDAAKEKAFGQNKINLINQEIDALKDEAEAIAELAKEAKDWKDYDLQVLRDEGVNIQLGTNGEILNYEELAVQYQKPATEDKDETAEKIWNEIMKYEESLNKWQEAMGQYTDKLREYVDKITESVETTIELKADSAERTLDMLQYLINKTKDDAYSAAEAIYLIGKKADEISGKLNTNQENIKNVLKAKLDDYGMSVAEQNSLIERFLAGDQNAAATLQSLQKVGANGTSVSLFTSSDWELITKQTDEAIKNLNELSNTTKEGLNQITSAFSTFSSGLNKQVSKFNNYSDILSTYKDIVDMFGKDNLGVSDEIIKGINAATIQNAKNLKNSTQTMYNTLLRQREIAVEKLNQVLATGNEALINEARKAMETIDDQVESTYQELITNSKSLLDAIAEQFKNSVELIVDSFEDSISPLFKNIDSLQSAFDNQQKLNDRYVEDYERLYNLSHLTRDIQQAIDDTDSIKGQKSLKKLLAEINQLQEEGTELSDYDLDVLQKKFELEKARLALDESKNAKNMVRLARDTEGNWGYVYTANDDEVAKAEQEYEDKLKALQDANHEYINSIQSEILDLEKTTASELREIWSDTTKTFEEKLADTLRLEAQYKETLSILMSQFNNALNNQADTFEKSTDRYKVASLDLLDLFSETSLSKLTGFTTLEGMQSSFLSSFDATVQELMQAQQALDSEVEEQGVGQFITHGLSEVTEMTEITTEKINTMSSDIVTAFKGIADQFSDTFGPDKLRQIQALTAETERWALALTNTINAMSGASQLNLNNDPNKYHESPVLGNLNGVADKDAYTGMWDMMTKLIGTTDTLNTINMQNIMSVIDRYSGLLASGITIKPSDVERNNNMLEQTVHITAEFPNAVNHTEIEQAFTNLVNEAAQFANRK